MWIRLAVGAPYRWMAVPAGRLGFELGSTIGFDDWVVVMTLDGATHRLRVCLYVCRWVVCALVAIRAVLPQLDVTVLGCGLGGVMTGNGSRSERKVSCLRVLPEVLPLRRDLQGLWPQRPPRATRATGRSCCPSGSANGSREPTSAPTAGTWGPPRRSGALAADLGRAWVGLAERAAGP